MESLTSNQQALLQLYKYMFASRESDIVESELVNSGEANFLASSMGHEGSAILGPFLRPSDWLHCHYRDKALMLYRGISSTMFFYSALTKAESHSCGRQMVSHMSAPELNIMSIVGPIGNNALQAVGVATSIKNAPEQPIVVCSIGDGTSQQGEVLEAIAEAKRNCLPVLFFIHNNNLAISTRTIGQTFFSLPDQPQPESFYATPITHIDGINPLTSYEEVSSIIATMRIDRAPQIIVFNVDRLDNHSNADDQKLYRSQNELIQSKKNDPLILSANYLLQLGISQATITQLERNTITEVRMAVDKARLGSQPMAVFNAEKELTNEFLNKDEYRGNFDTTPRLTMLEAMRQVFYNQLQSDTNVYLFGQDIEDGKGDVFGITKGLSTAFPSQVKNSPLSEATIVGMASGLALTGKRPVAFIQFADFMPLAYNQIFSELATMYWRTNGGWQCPVIVFAACGAYRPGLGPFHSQTNEATYAHIPGLDVYMPANASDAAGMLNMAFQSGRPSLYLYPKKLLNNSSKLDTTSSDIDKHWVGLARARIARPGSDITLVGLGNTVALCYMVADTLETIGIDAEIIDLRTVKPYDLHTILHSAERTGHLLVTHEDNLTCGIGGEIIAAVAEHAKQSIKVCRVTRSDTYVPCNFNNQLEVLPSYENILTACAKLLDLSLTWQVDEPDDDSLYNVEVIGASPSDESILITKIHVGVGDKVKTGDLLVDIEASKSAGEILSPCSGIIEEICVIEATQAIVGSNLLKIKLADGRSIAQKQVKRPLLTRNIAKIASDQSALTSTISAVGIGKPHFRTGSRKVHNDEILQNFTKNTHADIVQRTGIKSRYWLADNENIVDIAANVAVETLEANGLTLDEIDMIICATCTPDKYNSPSTACLILEKLYHKYGEHAIAAYDINAACSGYIYALQNAKDYLQTRPNNRVLLITAEFITKYLDKSDFDTAFLFGDAATATIIYGAKHLANSYAIIDQVYLSALAENGDVLNIPTTPNSSVTLQGKKLFTFAVKNMSMVMHKCCQQAGVELKNIDLVIPHQANQRIINAIEKRLDLPSGILYSNIATYGNTSSCTIPIALSEAADSLSSGNSLAFCAFGGGFTSAAAILTVR